MVIETITMVTWKGNIDWKGAQENFLEGWRFLYCDPGDSYVGVDTGQD